MQAPVREYTVEIWENVTNLITVSASSKKEAYLKAVNVFQQSDGGTYYADSEVTCVSVDGDVIEDDQNIT